MYERRRFTQVRHFFLYWNGEYRLKASEQASVHKVQVAGLVGYFLAHKKVPVGKGKAAYNMRTYLQSSKASWPRVPEGPRVLWNGMNGSDPSSHQRGLTSPSLDRLQLHTANRTLVPYV